jgi:hypothetical protein
MMASPNQGMKVQPQAGLAALAQPAQAPRGMPQKGIQQIMDSARKMSDAQLADVLSGKSMDVPQYVAMTEAMGRKSLRNAVQGQQAMQQAKQPSLKDKFLTEEAQAQMAQQMAQAPQMGGQGLAGIPAPNMDSMDMASGGIIAFDEGGDVPHFNEGGNWFTEWRDSLYSPEEKRYSDIKRGKKTDQPTDTLSENQVNALLRGKTPGPAEAPMPPSEMQSEIDASKLRLFKQEMAAKEEAANAKPLSAGPAKIPGAAPKAPIVGVGAGAGGANPYAIPSYESLQGKKSTDYLSKLADLTEKQRAGIGAIKKEGGGEALMQLASGILSRPTLAQGLGAALPLVASTSAATRKETRAVENAANDYDLNLAKAQEAAEKGDTENQLKYMQLANEAKYRADTIGLQGAQLNQLPDAVRTAMAIQKDPSLAQFFPNMTKASQISLTDAAKQWNDLPKENRKYYKELQGMGINSEQDYYKFVNGQLLSATIPGQGANIRPYS